MNYLINYNYELFNKPLIYKIFVKYRIISLLSVSLKYRIILLVSVSLKYRIISLVTVSLKYCIVLLVSVSLKYSIILLVSVSLKYRIVSLVLVSLKYCIVSLVLVLVSTVSFWTVCNPTEISLLEICDETVLKSHKVLEQKLERNVCLEYRYLNVLFVSE